MEKSPTPPKEPANKVARSFQAMQGTTRAYPSYTLNIFKQIARVNVDKVTLKFGVTVAISKQNYPFEDVPQMGS
ncbi:CU044_2847 family protein [Nodosilinea sp. P-1105]|uniref:CU044_2847 family protein n=1 Tax=Nodosilinea sp. P-1105 TaxID=2546229 RepID=UPI00241463C1|nr:CU044_2847 family protein [Nodosilinea sp. P-1105]